MSEADKRFLAMLTEIEQTKAPCMDSLRRFVRTQGMEGLVGLLSGIQDGAKTGKLLNEDVVRCACELAAIKFVEAVEVLKAEGRLALGLPPRNVLRRLRKGFDE